MEGQSVESNHSPEQDQAPKESNSFDMDKSLNDQTNDNLINLDENQKQSDIRRLRKFHHLLSLKTEPLNDAFQIKISKLDDEVSSEKTT